MKKFSGIAIAFFLFFAAIHLMAQPPERPLSVGIFVYPRVEILDFSGPSEVFGSTPGFKPFVVAFKKEPIVSQGFITITPEYSIDDCPHTDILVFPGGGTGSVMNEPKMIEWIKKRAETTQIMMSVCTGAGLLSKAGLLDGKEATTFHGYIDQLQKITPAAKILVNARFVDNGQVITTAGVSAGIDGALHVVAKIKGEEAAKNTALYMEYDGWKPDSGKVIETQFLRDVRDLGFEVGLKKHESSVSPLPLFYPSELKAVAISFLQSKPAESEAVFRYLLKKSPPTPALYDGLGNAFERLGKTAPPGSRSFFDKLVEGDIAWAKSVYQKTTKSEPNWLFFTEDDINRAAYDLMNNKKNAPALEVFNWMTELYPDSPNAWDSLAEFYETTGENDRAAAASRTCLAKIPTSDLDPQRKTLYEKISRERMERLKARP
ncbi:MAG: DJ-1/PfpI family protein [Saprospiraceae bacterium]